MKFNRRRRILINLITAALVSTAALSFISCQKQQSAPATQTARQTQTPVASPSQKAEPKTYHGQGVVTKIVLENPYDKTLSSVELDHGEIVGLMPPMRMEFYVKQKSLLKGLKVGDQVDFTLEMKDSAEIVSEIKKK